MADVLVVAGEPPWPAVHGGRIRTGRLTEVLARHFDVCVAAPREGPVPDAVVLEELPEEPPPTRPRAVLSRQPRLGHALMGPARREAVVRAIARHRPAAVVFGHSYLAAAFGPTPGLSRVVDFQDVEVRRMESLSRRGTAQYRTAAAVEALKARWWEPPVARGSAVVTATNGDDLRLLASWGARAVLVPHGADACAAVPSPAHGPVTFVGSMGYPPNGDAARWLVQNFWPRLRAAEPGLRLRIVGRQASQVLGWSGERGGLEVVADPDEVRRFLRDASVVVVPVRTGGGAQVKMAEAVCEGRVVVASAFSARSAPDGANAAVVVADGVESMAAQVVELWRDVEGRWARERSLWAAAPVPSWEEAVAPLVEVVGPLVRR